MGTETEPLKILHLYDGHEQVYDGQGSLPRIIWTVARRTAERGHDVTILERQWHDLPRQATHDGVDFHRLELRTGSNEPWDQVPYKMVESLPGLARLVVDRINFALQAWRVLRQSDFDVVHVYLPFAANVLITLAPWLRRRFVYTAQLGELRLNALTTEDDAEEFDVPGPLRLFSPDIYLARRVAYTTVLNPEVKEIFARNGVPRDSLVHIPNGVDITGFGEVTQAERDQVRAKFGLDDSPVIFYAGTVMPRKGVAQLVEAVSAIINDGRDDVHLVIAGETDLDETYFDKVTSIIAEGGIADNVTFTGYLDDDDLVPLYAAADVFVLPSFEEGFGMVVSEAMATGTPVVASRISGINQQIVNGETGLMVEPGSVDQLADALAELLDNPDRRRAMGERSRERAQRFSWERVADQYLEVYARLREDR